MWAGDDELVVEHRDGVGLPHHEVHVALVVEQDRPTLPAHVQASQVHHDRIAPARKLHRPAGVGGHREPPQLLGFPFARSRFQLD
jgi:hypothetical protein